MINLIAGADQSGPRVTAPDLFDQIKQLADDDGDDVSQPRFSGHGVVGKSVFVIADYVSFEPIKYVDRRRMVDAGDRRVMRDRVAQLGQAFERGRDEFVDCANRQGEVNSALQPVEVLFKQGFGAIGLNAEPSQAKRGQVLFNEARRQYDQKSDVGLFVDRDNQGIDVFVVPLRVHFPAFGPLGAIRA